MVEPLVASSGECGGGLGAVVPAVGDDGPQQDVGTAVTALVLLALCMPVVCESPTTSISSSSSMVCVADAPLLSNDVLVGDTLADAVTLIIGVVVDVGGVVVVVVDDCVDGSTVSIVVCVESSERSCHGYAFHFFAIKQRGIVRKIREDSKNTNCPSGRSCFSFGFEKTKRKEWKWETAEKRRRNWFSFEHFYLHKPNKRWLKNWLFALSLFLSLSLLLYLLIR